MTTNTRYQESSSSSGSEEFDICGSVQSSEEKNSEDIDDSWLQDLEEHIKNNPDSDPEEEKKNKVDNEDNERKVQERLMDLKKAQNFRKSRVQTMIVSSRSSDPNSDAINRLLSPRTKGSMVHMPMSKAKIKNKSKKDKTFVHFGNDNWNLVLHMLFGIRKSVYSVLYDDVYQLTDTEFQSKFRYELEAISMKDNS